MIATKKLLCYKKSIFYTKKMEKFDFKVHCKKEYRFEDKRKR